MKEESYKNIFKTTFLFGFVQVFNILIKVITNKIVAVLLGAEGMGIVGIYNNTLEFIKSGTSLGEIYQKQMQKMMINVSLRQFL